MNLMRGFHCVLILLCALFITACGHGEQGQTSQAGLYSKGGLKVEDQLKFDARVLDSSIEGKQLIVNVSQDWVASPAGMKERSVGQWYRLWLEAQGAEEGKAPKELQVIVRHDGNDQAKWTSDGYQIVMPKKGKDDGSRSES